MKSRHSVRITLFLLLSGLDLLLTWRLLRQSDGCVYETNPLANACLSSFGMSGLVFYKLATVANTLALCSIISLYRPAASRFVLTFACCILTGVVLYSSYLWGFGAIQESDAWPRAPFAIMNEK